MIDGIWRGGNDILDIVIEQRKGKLLICLPTEDIFDRVPFVSEIKKSSLSFSLFNFVYYLSLENNILRGYYIISNRRQCSGKKFNIELVAIDKTIKQKLNYNISRFELLCNNEKYEYESNIDLVFRYPNINKFSYYSKVKDIFHTDIDDLECELMKFTKLLQKVCSLVKHDGYIVLPQERDSVSLYEYSKINNNSLNCRGLALVLTDLCLAYGFKARNITCVQKENKFLDAHVVVIAFSIQYNKWIFLDPSYNLMIYDEKSIPLSLEEIRKKVIAKEPLYANEGANCQGGKLNLNFYFKTMYKKLYRFYSPLLLYPGHDNNVTVNEIELVPKNDFIQRRYQTSNPHFFWNSI